MNAKNLVVSLVIGMLLAAFSASAGWGINRATYASRFRPAPSAPAPAPAFALAQAKPEVQVAIMAQIKTECPTVSIWYGTGAKSRATHSH